MKCCLSWPSCRSLLVMPLTVLEYMNHCLLFSSHGQAADGTISSFLCMWAFSQLCPVLSLTIITCSGLLRRWKASFFWFCLISALIMGALANISFWVLYLCTFFVSLSACSFPGTLQWASIHCRATLSSCRAFVGCDNVLLVRACRTESTSVRNTTRVLFCCESTSREMSIITVTESAL